MDDRQENINNTLTDCDLKSALDSLHELNYCDNILSQLDIDSKYYEVDQINSIASEQTIDYKYKIMRINVCNNRITKMKGGVGIYVNDIHQF